VSHPGSLPRFAKPPVVETILGVHFRPLEKLSSAHQGVLWDRCFRDRFPHVEERGPVEEIREAFGEKLAMPVPVVRWQVSDRPPAPRLWAASSDGQYILQVQRDALLANWLKTSNSTSYRSYDQRRKDFSADLERVDEFLKLEEIGSVVPTSCIVTYINHVDCSEPSRLAPVLADTIAFWADDTSDGWLPPPDKINLHFAFPMPDNSGRLNVHVAPAVRRSDKRHFLRIELTARGAPEGEEIAAAMEWLDLGHEWVVRGFTSITRDGMHKLWERIQ